MESDLRTPVTELIAAARAGCPEDRERLYEAVYAELKAIARGLPRAGRAGETLQPTVLVSELFLEFERRFPPPPKELSESRATFYRSAALAMRSLLRDHWRGQQALKRGGGGRPASLLEGVECAADDGYAAEEFLALDEAMERLERFNRRWYDVVMHRAFAGRTIAQTAELLDLAASTVTADWKLARSWLAQELEQKR